MVINKFVDHRALGVGPQLQLAELHRQGIEQQQPAAEGGADAGDDLHRLGGLDHADDSGQHAHHAALGAGGHHARRRRLREKVPVVGAGCIQVEHRGLTFKAEDRAVDIWLTQQHAGVVHQVAGGEVVRAVADQVVAGNDLQGIFAGEGGLVEIHLAVGIDLQDAGLGRFNLGLANPAGAMDHLALEVGVVDHIEIDDAEPAYAGSR